MPESWQEVLVAASDGTFARDLRLHQTTGLTVLAADGDHRASISRRSGCADEPGFLARWPVEDVAASACQSAGKMLYADVVKAGDLPRGAGPTALAGSFSMKPVAICWKLPRWSGDPPLCRQARPSHCPFPAVTAIDEGLSDNSFGSMAMDDEGMTPQRTVLIKDGVLQCFPE